MADAAAGAITLVGFNSLKNPATLAGAGALGDLGAHVLAMARFLVGEVTTVCAQATTVIPRRPQVAAGSGYRAASRADAPLRRVENEDAVQALLRFAGGATGVLETSRVATGRKVHLAYEITGSRGSLRFDHERMNELHLYQADDPADRRGYRNVIMGPEHPYYGRFWPVAGCGLGRASGTVQAPASRGSRSTMPR